MTDNLDETPSPEFSQNVCQNVFTPEGTPGPPGAASTVARPPPRPRRLPNVNLKLHDEDLEGITIRNFSLENASVSFTRHHDTPYSSPNIQPERSSLGILNPEFMNQEPSINSWALKTDFSIQYNHNNLDQSYTPPKVIGNLNENPIETSDTPPKQIPTPSEEDLESPSKDDSIETVIPKEKGINPRYLAPTPNHLKPVHEMKGCLSCFLDSTIIEEEEPPSGIFALEKTDCQNMEKMNQNNFDDFEELAKNQSLEFSKSGCYQAFGGEFNEDVAAQMAEQQGLEFEAFEPINDAFEAELESNEKELEDEQRFVIQDDLLQSLNKSEEVTDKPEDEIKELSPKSSERSESDESSKPSESMTDYFQQCSSKLGHSLSSSNSGGSRPNFGFGNLGSPGITQPIALIDEEIIKETVALSISKNLDLTKKQEQEISEIAKIISQASPGHDAKYYADLVLKRILANEKRELEATLKLEQGLPSFLEETAVEIGRRKSIIRHSSPKKPPTGKSSAIPQRRIPFGNITNNVDSSLKVTKQLSSKQTIENPIEANIEYKHPPKPTLEPINEFSKFPIESNRLNLNWFLFNESTQDQVLTLRNKLTEKPVKVSLQIRNDTHGLFSLDHNTIAEQDLNPRNVTKLDIVIDPSAKKDVIVKYSSKSSVIPNMTQEDPLTAALVIKPFGLSKIPGRKSLKSKVQLQAWNFGTCKMSVFCNEKELLVNSNEKMFSIQAENNSLDVKVKNYGECETFFKAVILDHDDHHHGAENAQFVLAQGQEKFVKMMLPSNRHTCELAIFNGPEITRQIFKSCSFGANNSFLLGQDFKVPFDGEEKCRQIEVKNQRDLKPFFHNIQRQVVKIQMNPPIVVVADHPTFVTLPIEEDFSEFDQTANNTTRNKTKIYTFMRQSTTNSEAESTHHQASIKELTKANLKKHAVASSSSSVSNVNKQLRKSKQPTANKRQSTMTEQSLTTTSRLSQCSTTRCKLKNTIHLDREIIHFPTVRMPNSSSVAKVTLKNRTDNAAKFQVGTLEPPFENYYTEIEVKPHYYLSLPVRFKPGAADVLNQDKTLISTEGNNAKKSVSHLTLTNIQTGQILQATLIATCEYYS